MLEAFHDRLRDLCAHHGQGAGLQRDGLIQWQAQQARTLADEFGILKPFETTWTLYFEASGWKWIADPAGADGHLLFFHYPQAVLAVDALPRNCFLHDGTLLPFDVILCRPDAEIEEFLGLYPG